MSASACLFIHTSLSSLIIYTHDCCPFILDTPINLHSNKRTPVNCVIYYKQEHECNDFCIYCLNIMWNIVRIRTAIYTDFTTYITWHFILVGTGIAKL